jgi:hypothetical protein
LTEDAAIVACRDRADATDALAKVPASTALVWIAIVSAFLRRRRPSTEETRR